MLNPHIIPLRFNTLHTKIQRTVISVQNGTCVPRAHLRGISDLPVAP